MTTIAPVASPPQLPEHLERSLAVDIAADIWTGDDLGNRYHLGGHQGLKAYLRVRPKLVAAIQEMQTINRSATGAEDRLRLKCALTAEATVHHVGATVANPASTPAQKTDAFGQLLKGAGITMPNKNAQGSGVTNNFTVNYMYSRRPTRTISGLAAVEVDEFPVANATPELDES